MRDDERAARIVRFWRAIEMFSPQDVPKPTNDFGKGTSQTILDVDADGPAPWQPGHPLTQRPVPKGMAWQFTVYGGLYDVSAARRELVRVFGEDTKPEDARAGGATAMFAFTLDAEGFLLENSATLSACVWATSRLRSPGPDNPLWLDGFEDEEGAFGDGLNRLVPPKPAPNGDAGAGSAIARRAKRAAVDAAAAGAKAVGSAVGTMAGAAVGSITGPIVGGIAGSVASKFAESFLTPRPAEPAPGSTPVRIPLTMTPQALHRFVRELSTDLNVDTMLAPKGVRVKCTLVPIRETDEPADQAFLNSFIANDLDRIERAVRENDIGIALREYLTDTRDIDTGRRVDVRARRDAVVTGVQPRQVPGGRWPTDPAKPLVISQQFAVNEIMRELGDRPGVFAVNGPPGTGKTTMLRDVLAAIVVERARRLAVLRDPSSAFTDVLERVPLGSSNYRPAVRGIRPELTGFEIVVATAGNDAAANVTAEIPGIAAVRGGEEEALAADYFRGLASHVLGGPAWGMVASVLGNMKLRGAFAQRFWFGDAAGKDAANVGMMQILKQAEQDPGSVPSWESAVAAFRAAETDVHRLVADRQEVADAIAALPLLLGEISNATRELSNLQAVCSGLTESVHQARSFAAQAKEEFEEADREYQGHVDHKPGFWVSLSTFFRAGREWRERDKHLAEQCDAAKNRRNETSQVLAARQRDLAEQLAAKQRREYALNDLKRDRSAVVARIDGGRARWPGRVPYGDDVAADEPFQLLAPWADEELTIARNRLFLAALRLHKAFLLNTATQARGNLAVAVALLRGRLPLRPETLRAAWQALFLVVPMISTTFASLPRLFAGMGRESLGWLFIDEAGQATPQQAAGGLWRSRRAVIVGDPQQLEPVITLPFSAQEAIRRHHRVDEQWTPDATSVQRVADRLAAHGTTLYEPDGVTPVWVGAPLRVHRRCDHPIFEISNIIAYGGDLMVYGTMPRNPFPGENTWLDVQSGQSRGNWIPAEGEALLALLTELATQGISPNDIRIISPFRNTIRGCADLVRGTFGHDFAKNNVGTVHTVQGQESDIIIIVLGGANSRARAWAAEKPNLLNVATSRAKRRLYVIGNHANWHDLPYFATLAAALTVRRDT